MLESYAWSIYGIERGFGAVVRSARGLHRVYLPAYAPREIAADVERRYGAAAKRVARLDECDLLEKYFRGIEVDFSAFGLDLSGYGHFERRIYEEASKIPYGCAVSYGKLAERAGYPGAARAVGNAMRKNRLPIAVPCHRVIRAEGRLGGWSGPIGWKERLLAIEGIEIARARRWISDPRSEGANRGLKGE